MAPKPLYALQRREDEEATPASTHAGVLVNGAPCVKMRQGTCYVQDFKSSRLGKFWGEENPRAGILVNVIIRFTIKLLNMTIRFLLLLATSAQWVLVVAAQGKRETQRIKRTGERTGNASLSYPYWHKRRKFRSSMRRQQAPCYTTTSHVWGVHSLFVNISISFHRLSILDVHRKLQLSIRKP